MGPPEVKVLIIFVVLGKPTEGKSRGSCEAERIKESRTSSEVSLHLNGTKIVGT